MPNSTHDLNSCSATQLRYLRFFSIRAAAASIMLHGLKVGTMSCAVDYFWFLQRLKAAAATFVSHFQINNFLCFLDPPFAQHSGIHEMVGKARGQTSCSNRRLCLWGRVPIILLWPGHGWVFSKIHPRWMIYVCSFFAAYPYPVQLHFQFGAANTYSMICNVLWASTSMPAPACSTKSWLNIFALSLLWPSTLKDLRMDSNLSPHFECKLCRHPDWSAADPWGRTGNLPAPSIYRNCKPSERRPAWHPMRHGLSCLPYTHITNTHDGWIYNIIKRTQA